MCNNPTAAATNGSVQTKDVAPDLTKRQSKYARLELPWYIQGGMQTNLMGMGLNILIPPMLWASLLGGRRSQLIYYTLYILSILTAKYGGQMKTIFCTLIVPTYYCSMFLSFWALADQNPIRLILVSFVLGMIKVGIPMSICLHRYAAHQAFTCGPVVKWCLLFTSCLAHQGGPLWWAATHRAHHKFCDTPGDPHSPQIDGVERAFSFFWVKIRVLKDFVPRHLQATSSMWLLDTWAFAVHSLEMAVAYAVGGHALMFIAYTSAWMCQVTTLWFNVINHPDDEETDRSAEDKNDMRKQCVASDYKSNGLLALPPGTSMAGRFIPFHILNFTNFFFAQMSAEDQHKHHHAHARLAQRTPGDVFYWSFVYPLEVFGLVWNVQHLSDKES